jgi:asparagine synthase (glutamine-hydrolysing)
MCGITGHLSGDPDRAIERALLERMTGSLRHRGPDSEGYFVADGVGMGVRRLAVIDIAGGDQPVSGEDGSVVLTFNGEIYNFLELRAELEGCGHSFRSKGDSEVIAHAYEQWGDEALLRLNGMFAIALWDRRRHRLLLARDFMGEKPLYWHDSEAGLTWASEAKALLALPWIRPGIDLLALHHYLTLQYVPNPLTIYEGIRQLPAAHKLVVERGCEPRVERYWQASFEPKWEVSEQEALEESRTLLRAAVERRLVSEVPLGAFLSGGIDSSIVVALMADASSRPVRTFSIGFEERYHSETHHARQVAQHYGTEHHEYIFRPDDLAAVIERTVQATDEPLADPAILPLYELARQARSHVTVALCGDGGDETLAGYRRYALDPLLKPYALLPAWVTQGLVPALADLLPEAAWLPEGRNPFAGLKRLRQWAATTPKASMLRWDSYFDHDDKLQLYADSWRERLADIDTADWVARSYDEAIAAADLDRTLHADQSTYLPGDLLPKTDRATMAHSLEARAPFLDVDWVSWSARLPERFKLRGWRTKWLLKKTFADILPPGIAGRGKQGFNLPLAMWLRRQLRPWVHGRLLENSRLHEYFRPQEVRRYVDEHVSGRADHAKRLWALLIFSVWLDMRS